MILFMHPSIAHAHPYGMPLLHMHGSSAYNVVCCCYVSPTDDPMGEPIMAGLPWGLQKHAIGHVLWLLPTCTI